MRNGDPNVESNKITGIYEKIDREKLYQENREKCMYHSEEA